MAEQKSRKEILLTLTAPIIAFVLYGIALSGCAGRQEKTAQETAVELERYRIEQAARLLEKQQAQRLSAVTPLVKFHFVDSGGQLQKLEINQRLEP